MYSKLAEGQREEKDLDLTEPVKWVVWRRKIDDLVIDDDDGNDGERFVVDYGKGEDQSVPKAPVNWFRYLCTATYLIVYVCTYKISKFAGKPLWNEQMKAQW